MYPALVGKDPRPDGGHWAIYVEGRFNNRSTNPRLGRTKMLRPGTYTVFAALVNNDGTQLRPRVRSGLVNVRVGAMDGGPPTTPDEPPAVTTE
jgi:hypothetical protein